MEVPQGQVVLAMGLGRTPVVKGSRVRQKRVPLFPRLEAGCYPESPSTAWAETRESLEPGLALSQEQLSAVTLPHPAWLRAQRQPLKPEGMGTFTPES